MNISDPFGIANTDAVASRQDDTSQQADTMQMQADADTSRQHNASRVDNAEAYPPRIPVDTGELRHTTTRYNLRKRPHSAAHRIWVKEESDSADPVSYQNAVKHPTLGLEWSEAVRKELHSLHSNDTWDYIKPEDIPVGVKPISSKWVFKTKQLPGGGIQYKARLVMRGYEQIHGVDFDETFAPVAKLSSVRMLFALAAIHD